MGILLSTLLFLVVIGTFLWWAYQAARRIDVLESRLGWLEVVLRQAGIHISNDDYIKYCLLTRGTVRAIAEYRRIYQVSWRESRRALEKINADLRGAKE